MGVHIKSDEFERLARRLADDRGTSVEEALTQLVRRELESRGLEPVEDEGVRRAKLIIKAAEAREALLSPEEREARRRSEEEFMALVRSIQRRVAELPVLDPRPIDEILYDEDGLPK